MTRSEVPHVLRQRRPTWPSALPSLPPAAQLAVLRNNRLRLHVYLRVRPPGPTSPQHHPKPPILVGELQTLPALLPLVHLQLLFERHDPKALIPAAKEQQRDHPEQHPHENPLTPRYRVADLRASAGRPPVPCRVHVDRPSTGRSLRISNRTPSGDGCAAERPAPNGGMRGFVRVS